MEEKDKTEFDLGFERGYKDGFRAGRHDEFISPLKQRILIGLLIAATVIFGLFAIGFLGSALVDNIIGGIIGTIICGLIAGASAGAAYYLMEDIKL